MEHFHENIKGWFTFPELYKDIVNWAEPNSNIVEVGIYNGCSLSYLIVEAINSGKKLNIFGVDPYNEPEMKTNEMIYTLFTNLLPVINEFKFINKTAVEASKDFEDDTVDFVFIDSFHSYECVKEDTLAWLPKIRKGGIIAGHDYSDAFPDVIEAVDDIFGDMVNKDYINEYCWLVFL